MDRDGTEQSTGRRLMRGSGVAPDPELTGARALREWIAGVHDSYARVFLVEDGVDTASVCEVAGEGDAVLLPTGSAPQRGSASVAFYDGAFSDIGDELFLGEWGVELQDYVAAAFVQIIGPTAVCLHDELSWLAFLDDADLARRTGVFPSALIDPHVLLADRDALEGPGDSVLPRRIRIASGGLVSVGTQGEVLGGIDELPSILMRPLPRAAALGRLRPPGGIGAELGNRGGVGRYLNATDLIKMLGLKNGAIRIAGFGWSLSDDDRADAEPANADPFLLETADGILLADTTTLRRQLLSAATATVVAVTQTSSSLEVAAERVARRLDMAVSEAGGLCREAVTALDVHLGIRSDRSRPAIGAGR